MQASATSELEIRRYKAAVAELRAAGLFSSFRNDDGPSWWETVFQAGRPIEYLAPRQSFVSCALFLVPVNIAIHLLFHLNDPQAIPVLLIRIVLNGLLLPWVVTSVAWRQTQRHGLTPWEDLAR